MTMACSTAGRLGRVQKIFRLRPAADQLLICCLFGTLHIISGCAQKAKTIQVGAAQFKMESLAAIEGRGVGCWG